MSEGIFLLQQNDELIEMVEQEYDSEELLQKLLAKFPNLIPGAQIDSDNPRRWLLVSREMGVPCKEGMGGHWSVDHLFIDQDAIPTIVEVKRATDSRIRREVIGQILDYASNAVVYWSIEKIRTRYEAMCDERDVDPGEELLDRLGINDDIEEFWQRIKTNLQAGRVRLLIIADAIPKEVQRIVEFLNNQMDPAEFLAVEIKQFASENMKTLVPRVVGKTAKSDSTSSPSPRTWDEKSFFEELQSKREENIVVVARKLLDWAKTSKLPLWWGKGRTKGSFFPEFHLNGTNHMFFSVWTTGHIEILFQHFRPPFDEPEKKEAIYSKLMEIEGLYLPSDYQGKRPSSDLLALVDADNYRKFIDVFESMIKTIKES